MPETNAIALPAEPAGISGAADGTAIATAVVPAANNMIPRTN